ncbi:MAG: Gfo/Idh/MocA family oxidoreductase, partial [Alphaproteobacteria bacterium]|nr:Gfo/Idh/MocA family oxidoreductase [Alphaproteobacteria bacterium]
MTVKIGVIGTGAIGSDHARRINQVLSGGKIVALYDYNPSAAESVKSRVAPDAEIFASGEKLIASANVDAVLVTTTGATHEP